MHWSALEGYRHGAFGDTLGGKEGHMGCWARWLRRLIAHRMGEWC